MALIDTAIKALTQAGVENADKLDPDKAMAMFNNMVDKGQMPTPAENERMNQMGLGRQRFVDENEVAEKQAKVDELRPPIRQPRSFAERVIDKYIPDYTNANEKYEYAMNKRRRAYEDAQNELAEAKRGRFIEQGTPAEQERLRQQGIQDVPVPQRQVTPEEYANRYAKEKISEAAAEEQRDRYNFDKHEWDEIEDNLRDDLRLKDNHILNYDRKRNLAYIYDQKTDTTRAYDLKNREYKPGTIKGMV